MIQEAVGNRGQVTQSGDVVAADKRISVDVRVDGNGVLDQSVSIGTMFAGPIHIHVTVGATSGPAKQGKRKKKVAL